MEKEKKEQGRKLTRRQNAGSQVIVPRQVFFLAQFKIFASIVLHALDSTISSAREQSFHNSHIKKEANCATFLREEKKNPEEGSLWGAAEFFKYFLSLPLT